VSDHIIDDVYNALINILRKASDEAVPRSRKNFFRYWWDSRMKEVKERAVASCRMWKEAGRPRSGPIFDIYRKDKSVYKRELRAIGSERKEKSILMSCTRRYSKSRVEPSGTVGRPNLDVLEVA